MAKISPIFKKVTSFVFSKPATAGYPYVKPQLQENFRGQMQLDCKLYRLWALQQRLPGERN